jgi:hypothetical protein
MPFVECPNCHHSISDAAGICPNCRYVMPARPAPSLDVSDTPAAKIEASYAPLNVVELPCFEVSVRKFVVMSIVTWGVYPLYWAFEQWVRIARRKNERLSPIWRTIFAPLWNFSLFKRIKQEATARGAAVRWEPTLLALLYFMFGPLWRLPDPWWVVSLLTFLPVIPVVRTVTRLHDTLSPTRDRNDRFSGANVVGIVFGSAVLALVLVGLSLGPQQS